MTDADEIRVLLRRVHERPRMWLPSSHYGAIVSFIQGMDAGTGGWLLTGFYEWMVALRASFGGAKIERQVTGREDGNSDSESDIYARPGDEESARCVEGLFRKLEEFLNQK